ncbi:MAG: nucleotidyltransferase domain-containing protein [Tissierellia bacterium]|nr:nucleotidyltransferase domain-containing protein [Tissierellia bacterium]
MNFGIPAKSMDLIIEAMAEYEEIERAAIFGSRSMGNYKNGSDVDIAIYGNDITMELVKRLSIKLNEILPLPYYFDIVHYESLKNEELKKHIDVFGKVFYIRKEGTN